MVVGLAYINSIRTLLRLLRHKKPQLASLGVSLLVILVILSSVEVCRNFWSPELFYDMCSVSFDSTSRFIFGA